MKPIKPKNHHLSVLLKSEVNVYLKYVYLIQKLSKSPDLDWIFNLKEKRKNVVLNLVDDYELNLSLEDPIEEIYFNTELIATKADLSKELKNIELDHLGVLISRAREYYCHPESKLIITKFLVPLANRNLADLDEIIHSSDKVAA